MTSRGAKEITWLFFILTLGDFLFFGLQIHRPFFFKIEKKIFYNILQAFYFYFVPRRYDTCFFNFKTRSPRTTSILFLYVNR